MTVSADPLVPLRGSYLMLSWDNHDEFNKRFMLPPQIVISHTLRVRNRNGVVCSFLKKANL